MIKRLTNDDIINKAMVVHGNKYDYTKLNYSSSKNKIEIICKKHGSFFQLVDNHINKKTGCPKCRCECLSKKFRCSIENFIEKANIIHKNIYDYSNTKYINSKTEIEILCKFHGIFKQKPNYHLNGNGCPKCVKNRPLDKSLFITLANQKHNNQYTYKNIKFKNFFKRISITCKKHGDFLQRPYKHLSGNGCPKCSKNISRMETNFLDILKINKRQFPIQNFKVDGIKNNKIFEFLGDFWHGNPKVYNKTDQNWINKKLFGELYKKTFLKFNILKQLGYHIYYIWERDWCKWKKDKSKPFPILKF